MRFYKFLIAALFIPNLCIAGGTVRTMELRLLISQMPAVRDLLGASINLADSAFAQVRLGPHFKNLGGARMGPYSIQARSKTDGRALVVVLCTQSRFLTSTGQELPDARIEEAVSIEEKLIGIMLRQEGSAVEGKPPC